jgi:hypothetical protein
MNRTIASNYICDNIHALDDSYDLIKEKEKYKLIQHFKHGDHKHPLEERLFCWWDVCDREIREEYLKYLVDFCKERKI